MALAGPQGTGLSICSIDGCVCLSVCERGEYVSVMSVRGSVYICVQVGVCICNYGCVNIYLNMLVCMHECTCVLMCVFTRVGLCECVTMNVCF